MKAKIILKTQITDYEGPGDFPADGAFVESLVNSMTDGTGASQAQVVFCDTRTLALSTSEDLDLAGSLEDQFGQTMTFTAIKAIFVKADSGNGALIAVGGAAANTFDGPFADSTDIVNVDAAGAAMFFNPTAAGWTVTAGTGDILKIENTDGAATGTYTIIIIGEGTVA